ncbi:MAG: DinB family protein [Bryobacterales bacterium]|nr:DinB family protein [Bryobacterales bacterium]
MQNRVSAVELTEQIDEIVARKEALVAGLSQAQKSWRPSPGAWSILECLDHINQADAVCLRAMRVTFERDRHNASLPPRTFRLGYLARLLLYFVEPPYHIKTPAPHSLAPSASLSPETVETEFTRLHLDLRGFILEATRVDMGVLRFRPPMSPLIRLNLAEGCSLLAAHDRRHLWQAEKIKQHLSFPAS